MFGIMTQSKKNEPIEAAIAEAMALFEKRFGKKPTLVRIHVSNPQSVFTPDGVVVEYVRGVLPGAAWAGVKE